MKIGIATIVDYKNYGNRLQNYALQEVLRSLGGEVATIVNAPYKPEEKASAFKRYHNRIKELGLKGNMNRVIEKINGDPKEKLLNKKKSKFKDFSNEYISETKYTVHPEAVPEELSRSFDFFVTGSDQVWNPNYRKGSPFDFLTFAPSLKRIAYAPSFGVSKIPEQYNNDYSRWIKDFAHLSVREDAGAELITNLTGRGAPVLVDPTLLLTKEEWIRFSKQPVVRPQKKYLLTYYLGTLSSDKQQFIGTIAKENGLEIVNLASYKDSEYYTIRPDEFVDMINNAEIFFTDSFHGAVFSIILQKSFVVFDRVGNAPSMNSRIDTLLNKFNLLDRKFDNIEKDKLWNINFNHVPAILVQERKKSLIYLREALNVRDAN